MNEEEIKDVYMLFAGRIKSKRKSKGITQEDMADELNMSRPNYTNIELGNHQVSLHQAIQICNILKMKVIE